jgi:hypothetical protein
LALDIANSGLVSWWIYIAPFPADQARKAIMKEVVNDCLAHDARRLIVEFADDGRNHRDRVVIARTLSEAKGHLHYSHEKPWSHPGLELADLGAWLYGAGGESREMLMPMVDQVRDLGQ